VFVVEKIPCFSQKMKWRYFKEPTSKLNKEGLFIVHKTRMMLPRIYDIL